VSFISVILIDPIALGLVRVVAAAFASHDSFVMLPEVL
jgi:hypothetical protein